jgi:hypothetical protein
MQVQDIHRLYAFNNCQAHDLHSDARSRVQAQQTTYDVCVV